MAYSITYANYLHEPVTKAEFDQLDSNSLIYNEGGLIKKVEDFKNRKLWHVSYYLADGESDVQNLLSQFSGIRKDIIKRTGYKNYYVHNVSSYDEGGSLIFLSDELYDENENQICDQHYDLTTLKPVFSKTEKKLYTNNNRLFSLGFDYHDDGRIKSIWGDWVEDTDQRRKGSIYGDDILRYFPNLFLDHPYYHNADFLSPFL